MSGTLVILRHGQSEWNLANLFTGWHDVPLTEKGRTEATAAGVTMADAGIRFDTSHTSLQTRAVVTQNLALDAMDQAWLPVERNWRLYDTPPPPVELDSPEHPANDARYAHLPPDVLPASECLKDVVDRVLPYWYDRIAPQLFDGLNVLVTAHGNSLRALLKHLESVSDADLAGINIPTGRLGATPSTTGCRSSAPTISVTPRQSQRRPPRLPPRPEPSTEQPSLLRCSLGVTERFKVPLMASKKQHLDTLREVSLFSGCNNKELEKVAKASDEIRMTAGTLIVDQGQTGREAFVVLEGDIEIKRNGRKVATLGPGAVVGELSLLDHGPRTATAVCATDCTLLVIDQRRFLGVIDSVPAISHKLLSSLAARIRDLDRQYFG